MEKRVKLLAIIPAIWASLFDIVITTIYQPAEYWNGNLDLANEANPFGAFVMKYHVSGLFVISVLWLILIAILGYYLPKKISRVFLLFIFIAHSSAGSFWINIHFGFLFMMIYLLLNSILYFKIDDIINLYQLKKISDVKKSNNV
ncbi:hypothetical protein [Ancylomarina sp. 16SWW S1-10-2]|uniref:hypothetical protein n=1 Tax=Ancylomarina sp. 16SWW S1-10-2 TaxID=2499681 RepID=UPI0012AD8A1B|nr:hypothetical protein [Ancylomarina sp. 16SWW S1-10-2]MRT92640.1 hypothetical protein [Ancylomarina sp. 16SWW S1-10-2]